MYVFLTYLVVILFYTNKYKIMTEGQLIKTYQIKCFEKNKLTDFKTNSFLILKNTFSQTK